MRGVVWFTLQIAIHGTAESYRKEVVTLQLAISIILNYYSHHE